MGLTATMTPGPVASNKLSLVGIVARRILLAALLTTLTMVAAIGAMFVTTAPQIVCVLIEPLSLLLMPGLLAALLSSGPTDLSPVSVVMVATGFYFAFFCLALWWLDRARRARRTSR